MVTLIHIYCPNTNSPEFYEYVRDFFLELDSEFFNTQSSVTLKV